MSAYICDGCKEPFCVECDGGRECAEGCGTFCDACYNGELYFGEVKHDPAHANAKEREDEE